MSHLNTIYNQRLHLIPRHHFDNLVKKYNGDYYVKYFTCWQQFMSLLYAQVKGKDSLRDIETSPKAQSSRRYHIRLEDIKRSTLSDANNQRDYRIYEEFFYTLLYKCKSITPKHKFRFKNPHWNYHEYSQKWPLRESVLLICFLVDTIISPRRASLTYNTLYFKRTVVKSFVK